MGFSNFFDQLTDDLIRVRNNFAYKQFERHGYSLKQIMEMSCDGRVTCTAILNMGITYFIDDEPIFKISEPQHNVEELSDSYKFTVCWLCEDIKEPVVKGES